jgi:transposase-like protein
LVILKPFLEEYMSPKKRQSPESIVREIKRKTRRKFSAEEKIRNVLAGLRGEQSITDLCRHLARRSAG